MNRQMNPAVGGVISCLEKYLQDTIISVDGMPAVPSYPELLGSYIGTYLVESSRTIHDHGCCACLELGRLDH